ncbi:hypothetical protein NDGK_01057 [Clostridiales bacterium CHKCI001]|nr:hypothetical protein NDGK_01057 [Clostridiales bacterium CHKCI001]
METNNNNITQYIRRSQCQQIIYPIILLVLTVLITTQQPIFDYMHLRSVAPTSPLSSVISHERFYVKTEHANLYYTGQDYWLNGELTGHYYYELTDNYCRFYILPASSGIPATSYLEDVTITGQAISFMDTTDEILSVMAQKLNWNKEGLNEITDPYIINTLVYLPLREQILFIALLICIVISFISIIRMLIYIINPLESPACRRLRKYGNLSQIITQVEQELDNNCIIRTSNMALTPNYLIEFSEDVSAIIPLSSVLWTYKHGDLRRNWKFQKKMRYSLHVITNKGDNFTFKNKQSADVEQILNELTNRYPSFFYGYSEEHQELMNHILKDLKMERKKKKMKNFKKK